MKAKTFLVLCLVTLLSACSTPSVQKLLDDALPAGYKGGAHIAPTNPYFHFTLDVTGLEKVNGLWTWKTLKYNGSSAVTHTEFYLVPDDSIQVK